LYIKDQSQNKIWCMCKTIIAWSYRKMLYYHYRSTTLKI